MRYHRTLLTRVPESAKPWVSTLVRTIFEQPGAASVQDQHAKRLKPGDPPSRRCGRDPPRSRRHHPLGRRGAAEQNDEWTESRCYMGLKILTACWEVGRAHMGKKDTSEAGLTVETIPASM
jgi:hypothetical protein